MTRPSQSNEQVRRAVSDVVEFLDKNTDQDARGEIRRLLERHGSLAAHDLQVQANGLAHRSKWCEAALIYKEVAAVDRSVRSKLRRARWCCTHTNAFWKYFRESSHADRIITKIRDTYPDARSIKIERIRNGLNSIAVFKHQIYDADGHRIAVAIEKTYIGYYPRNFRQAFSLHNVLGANRELIPTFLGRLRAGPFISTLHEFVSGERLRRNQWTPVQATLIQKMWEQHRVPAPTGRWRTLLHAQVRMHQMLGVGTLKDTTLIWPWSRLSDLIAIGLNGSFLHHLSPYLSADTSQRLYTLRENLEQRLLLLPHFVMHENLRPSNVIYNAEDRTYFVIDWDRWSVEPIGTGWPVDYTDLEPERPPVPNDILNNSPETQRIQSDMMLAAVMWQLRESSAKKRGEAIEPLANLLLEILEER